MADTVEDRIARIEKENEELRRLLTARAQTAVAGVDPSMLADSGFADILAAANQANPLANAGFRSFVNPVTGEIGGMPGLAPGGRNLNFTGGVPFRPDFTASRVRNLGALIANVMEARRVADERQQRTLGKIPAPQRRGSAPVVPGAFF